MGDAFIIVAGNPVDGFKYYGTYPDRESAAEAASVEISDTEWWIAELQPLSND